MATRQRDIRAKEIQALELRVSGRTYREIGAALSMSDVGARKAVNRALKKWGTPLADNYREVTLERLERLFRHHYTLALPLTRVLPDGQVVVKREGDLRHAEQARRIIEDERKLLGLDQPIKIALTHEERVYMVSMILGLPPEEVEDAVLEAEAMADRQQLLALMPGREED